jgi:probable HAF family extracellular repeat protein
MVVLGMQRVTPVREIIVSDQWNGGSVRLVTMLLASIALGMVACTSEESPTGPSAAASPARAAVKTYTAVDLGTLPGGRFSIANDINPAGQVVGGADDADGNPRAFIWAKGVMTDLGTLGGAFSGAVAINPAGQVVGGSSTATGLGHAFMWDKGIMTDLGTLGGQFSAAEAINPAGQVVGYSETARGEQHGFLWAKGVMTDLGPMTPRSINPRGQIVGGFQPPGPPGRAFLWVKGVTTDLGTLDGGPTFAADINPAGQVVGTSGAHAFLWEKGVMTDLGTLGENFILSYATGISPSGHGGRLQRDGGRSGNPCFCVGEGRHDRPGAARRGLFQQSPEHQSRGRCCRDKQDGLQPGSCHALDA